MATYYVSQAGNDSNNGTTTGTSWKTLSKLGSTTFAAGDSVLLNRGDTWAESWTVSAGGTTGNPITYGAYGSGAKPIVSGATSANNRRNLTFQNIVFSNGVGAFVPGFMCKPTSQQVQNITLDGCEATGNAYAGIWFLAESDFTCTNITIKNCTVYSNTILGIIVQGQDATHLITNVTLTNNHIYSNGNLSTGTHGVHIRFTDVITFTGNHIHDNTGSLNWSSGLYLDTGTNALVSRNSSHDNHWDNFHFDVNSNNLTCTYNESYNAPHQGYMVEEHIRANGTSVFKNNTSYNDARGFYMGPGSNIHTVSGLTVTNNHFANEVNSAIGIDLGSGVTTLAAGYLDNTIDYNHYVVGTSQESVAKVVSPDTLYTLAAWRAATGYDVHTTVTGRASTIQRPVATGRGTAANRSAATSRLSA